MLLVIDQRQNMFFGSRRAMKSVVAAEVSALADIYAQLDALRTREVQTVSHRPRRELFHWPLGVGVLLSLVYISPGLCARACVESLAYPQRQRLR
jgi:hypothetical protein